METKMDLWIECIKRGITVQQLAIWLGISHAMVWHYLNGNPMPIELVKELQKHMNISEKLASKSRKVWFTRRKEERRQAALAKMRKKRVEKKTSLE